MNVREAIRTKLDLREFSDEPVPGEIKMDVLEAARQTQSGSNTQHWRFVLVQDPRNLNKLAQDASWGGWVTHANFAVIVFTDPKLPYNMLDAGRAVQDMQLAAWDRGVASGVFMGLKEDKFRVDFGAPENLKPAIVVGFGYPKRRILGKKDRKPLSEVAFLENFSQPIQGQGAPVKHE